MQHSHRRQSKKTDTSAYSASSSPPHAGLRLSSRYKQGAEFPMAAVIALRTVSVAPGSTTAYSHTKMKKHFSFPSPCHPVARTAPVAKDCPFSLSLSLFQEGGKPPSSILSLENCCLGRALFEKRRSCLLCWALQCITESALQSPTAIQHHLSLPLAALHHSRVSAFQERPRAHPALLSPATQNGQQMQNAPPFCFTTVKLHMAAQWNCVRSEMGKGSWFAYISLCFFYKFSTMNTNVFNSSSTMLWKGSQVAALSKCWALCCHSYL